MGVMTFRYFLSITFFSTDYLQDIQHSIILAYITETFTTVKPNKVSIEFPAFLDTFLFFLTEALNKYALLI